MHLGLCYSRHELLAYTHPSAFGVRLLMHVWRLRAARILTPQCVRIASAPYCSCMCGSYMPLGEKPLGQDCGSHAPRTLQDCGFSCPWSSSKDNVPRASKQTSHFRAAPEMLGVVLYQSRASGVHPPQCIRICHHILHWSSRHCTLECKAACRALWAKCTSSRTTPSQVKMSLQAPRPLYRCLGDHDKV